MLEHYEELKKLLAAEMNCKPRDFDIEENALTVSSETTGGRSYCAKKPFFRMVTTGINAVITADEVLDGALIEFMKKGSGRDLFEAPNLFSLDAELRRFGYSLGPAKYLFLHFRDVEPSGKFNIRWYYDEEIRRFYGDSRFPNAICAEYEPERPDRIVVCACKGRDILGMAGCSEDAKGWMQIGVDVAPKSRSKGIGSYLAAALKNKIIENGDIPFYGTQAANLHSWNVALNAGFAPAWIEVEAIKL